MSFVVRKHFERLDKHYINTEQTIISISGLPELSGHPYNVELQQSSLKVTHIWTKSSLWEKLLLIFQFLRQKKGS